MRLWHYELINDLPNEQLIAQWKVLNTIYKNEPKHILINYIYDYPKEYLYTFSKIVINEMKRRNIKIHSYENFNNYFRDLDFDKIDKTVMHIFKEHNNDYYMICSFALYEKFLRGQKEFNSSLKIIFEKLRKEE